MGHASLIVPRGAAEARAYVCIPVDESVALRSSVIASLMNVEGFVDLPEDVDVSDFVSWSNVRPEEAAALSAAELSYALQIGDKLGDMHSEAWAQAMARKLVTTDWDDALESEIIQAITLSLNSHLQGRVFQELGNGRDVVAEVLSKWPPALEQAYFDALVESGAVTLHSHEYKHVQSILSHISRTAQASSGLVKLCVGASISTSTTTALLSRTLLHHSASLTDLAVPLLACHAFGESCLAVPVFSSLWRLSNLTSLMIGCTSPCEASDTETAHALAASIAKLPNLNQFSLRNMTIVSAPKSTATGGPNANKRRRLCSAGSSRPVISLDPVVAALSAAPSLTALSLSNDDRDRIVIWPESTTPFPCSGIHGAFSALQQLSVSIHDSNGSAMGPDRHVLPDEPLPALTFLQFDCSPGVLRPTAAEIVVRGFVQQPALREARLHLPSLPETAAQLIKQEFGELAHLEVLEVQLGRGACLSPAAVRTAAAGFAQLTALTHLRLDLVDRSADDVDSDDERVAAREELASMLMPLSALVSLQDLRCEALGDGRSGLSSRAMSAAMGPLSCFMRLTRLDVCGDDDALSAGALALRLRHLTGLRHLRAHMIEHEADCDVRECLRHLVQLTCLDLRLMPVDADVLECIGGCLEGMPGMKKVALATCDEDDPKWEVDGDWVTGLLAFPCRGVYELGFGIELMADSVRDVKRQLTERGGLIDDDFETLRFQVG